MSCFNVLFMYKLNILDNIPCHKNHHIDISDITMGISPVLEKKINRYVSDTWHHET